MQLDAIAVFVKVVELGSFSAAARSLKMPKTTVSAKVAALERRLGITLIQRTTRKLHITDAGQNYFRHCALAIKEIEKGESELVAEQGTPRGLLRITAPADLGHTLLPKIVCEYIGRYADTEIELVVTNRMVDLVGEGIDLAIRAGSLKDSSLVARKFFENCTGFWASPAYLKKHGTPAHPRDLEKHRLIAHSKFNVSALELTDEKATHVLSLKAQLRADDFETIKSLVMMKEGIGFMPEFLTSREVKARDLVAVLPKWRMKQSGALWFVYPGQKFSSPKIKAFIETAMETIKDEAFL